MVAHQCYTFQKRKAEQGYVPVAILLASDCTENDRKAIDIYSLAWGKISVCMKNRMANSLNYAVLKKTVERVIIF